MSEKLEKLISLLYQDKLTQYGKRLLVENIEKLQKENEKLRKQLNEENKRYMMLAIEKQDYFEKYRYNLQQNESLTKEFSNVIPVQKIKDKIEKYKKLSDKFYVKFLESDRYNIDIREKGIKCDAIILALEELIEEKEEE